MAAPEEALEEAQEAALAEVALAVAEDLITTDLITEDIGDRVAITEAEAVLEE